MTGAAIKATFNFLYESDGASDCGNVWLTNGCHLQVDRCTDCVDTRPMGDGVIHAGRLRRRFQQ